MLVDIWLLPEAPLTTALIAALVAVSTTVPITVLVIVEPKPGPELPVVPVGGRFPPELLVVPVPEPLPCEEELLGGPFRPRDVKYTLDVSRPAIG